MQSGDNNNSSEALYSMNKLLARGAVQYHKHKNQYNEMSKYYVPTPVIFLTTKKEKEAVSVDCCLKQQQVILF